MHTETIQSKYIQWYFGVVAAVLAFLYSGKYDQVEKHIGGLWVPLLVMVIYSVMVSLRLILQKRNYETYLERINEIEGKSETKSSIKNKKLSVFKLQYYSVVLVGSTVFYATVSEIGVWKPAALALGVGYGVALVKISFSALIQKDS